MKRSKTTDRLLATAIGIAIAATVVGAGACWLATYVHGTQACTRCNVAREVDCRGPFWFYSDPVPAHYHLEGDLDVNPCAEHEWVRVGCWTLPGATACYGGVRP